MDKVKNYNKSITILSVIIPLAIASLFRIKLDVKIPVFYLQFTPQLML